MKPTPIHFALKLIPMCVLTSLCLDLHNPQESRQTANVMLSCLSTSQHQHLTSIGLLDRSFTKSHTPLMKDQWQSIPSSVLPGIPKHIMPPAFKDEFPSSDFHSCP